MFMRTSPQFPESGEPYLTQHYLWEVVVISIERKSLNISEFLTVAPPIINELTNLRPPKLFYHVSLLTSISFL